MSKKILLQFMGKKTLLKFTANYMYFTVKKRQVSLFIEIEKNCKPKHKFYVTVLVFCVGNFFA